MQKELTYLAEKGRFGNEYPLMLARGSMNIQANVKRLNIVLVLVLSVLKLKSF